MLLHYKEKKNQKHLDNFTNWTKSLFFFFVLFYVHIDLKALIKVLCFLQPCFCHSKAGKWLTWDLLDSARPFSLANHSLRSLPKSLGGTITTGNRKEMLVLRRKMRNNPVHFSYLWRSTKSVSISPDKSRDNILLTPTAMQGYITLLFSSPPLSIPAGLSWSKEGPSSSTLIFNSLSVESN